MSLKRRAVMEAFLEPKSCQLYRLLLKNALFIAWKCRTLPQTVSPHTLSPGSMKCRVTVDSSLPRRMLSFTALRLDTAEAQHSLHLPFSPSL